MSEAARLHLDCSGMIGGTSLAALPRLAGRLDGIALRVPVPNGSIVDFVATLHRDVTTDEVNQAFRDAVHARATGE